MSIIHENLEPGVIDTNMLKKAVADLGPKGEAGRLAALEGVVLEEVTAIRLEFFNILKIDHLWMMTSLVKLQIGNNIIEKIENLDSLVNLKELDLSFNNIEEIENLDHLEKLEILTLFQNRISKLQNMEHLVNLMIFSIGNNKIVDWENVVYLRQFPQLRSLNMTGNPCTEKEYFKDYVYAFLPKLIYYAYRMVLPADREAACERYSKPLRRLEEAEAKQQTLFEAEKAEAKEVAYYSEAFMEHLNSDQLFKTMFAKDTDGKAMITMNEESEEIYVQYREQFLATIQELFEFGLEQHKIRQDEIKQFQKCVDDAKDECRKKSRTLMEDFINEKTEIFSDVRKILVSVEEEAEDEITDIIDRMQQCTDRFHDNCQRAWHDLMGYEMTLYEQLEETNNNFERNLNDLVGSFIEGAQGLFVQCRNLEMTFNEQLQELGNRYLTNINVRMDDPKLVIPQDLKYIMVDKESLNNAVSTSHDIHLQVIDTREDKLITRIRAWASNMCDNLQKEEVKRDRAKVIEINHFLDIQREEFEELQLSSGGKNINIL